jgi:uncharacterized protein YdhG (YjbR/CyaY superfamily)
MAAQKKTTSKTTSKKATTAGFSAAERAAMRERAKELKAEAAKADGEQALRAKIAEMPEADRRLAERIHAIVMETAPQLVPKTWYGMPAWAKDGKVLCFFQSGDKFDARYATFGFQDAASLDHGTMWPTSFALTDLTAADEKKIVTLVKKAVRG